MIITKNILPILQRLIPSNGIIIEAGAFNGSDTKKLSALVPDGAVHAFEPVPQIFAELTQQTHSYSNIYRHQIALSNTIGTAQFYLAENPKRPGKICQAGTIMPPKERLRVSPIRYSKTIMVPTTTLDAWAYKNSIPRVDFIWLDVQGHELAVLKSGTELLKTTTLIFLEVNFIEAYQDQPSLQEINQWLKDHGFSPIARDFIDQTQWFFGAMLYQK